LNFTDRIAGLDTNLEDLQAGIEATARAADTLQTDTTKFDGLLKASLLRAVVRHVQELQACARDQRAALQELRDSISRLRQELKRSHGVVRPPPIIGADAVRR
jgi:chromosome segregation ATPase